MTKVSLTCPISEERVNESVARVVAFFTILIVLLGVYFKSPLLLVALALDFYLRAFTTGKYSPLKYISKRLSNYLGMPQKMADAAPKKFAAGLGLIFTAVIAGALWLHYDLSAYTLTTVLLICAGLESFKGFCIGCVIYTYFILPLASLEDSEETTISINL